MLGALRTTVRDCGGLSLAATVIVPSILLFVTFIKVWHAIERILTAQSCFWSGLVAPFYAFSANLQMRWAGPEEVVPTVVLRNAIATTSAAGNAATYFVHEIGSLQRHSLATVDGVTLFTPMAVPTAEVAEVEQAIEKLQKGLEDFVPRELVRFYNIRATIAHMIRDLSPQHDAGSSPGGKEKKHHKTLRKHLRDPEKPLIETVNHRKEVREDAMEIEMSAGDAGRT
ncbi:uncharacterized protein C8A04DRAFT_24556 [Dichotomopilus funicola]|uniref:Uncharacterized protein n=1 Tax=Dichotomopilus funicola TaxID=1934379 RepID=A0AAN6V9P5_9PEZI|nr:hypothetical protein C8A04DRAFT_24556 [Dichotomopilus funicola]